MSEEVIVEPVVVEPPRITVAELLSSQQLLLQKEATDSATLGGIGSMSTETLRARLIQWASAGFPNAYTIYTVVIAPPTLCSDGVSRTLADYITFCSGKTIQEHVALLQAKVDDIQVSFAYTGSEIMIVVTKV